MSEEKQHSSEEKENSSEENQVNQEPSQQGVTRRQFLNYTLMGTGGFFVAAITTPMLGFAIDPILKAEEESDMVYVADMDDLGPEPTRVDFVLEVNDAWTSYDQTQSAWVMVKENGEVLALSPVCTHLGCTVQWDTFDDAPQHFYCPCHDGLYDADGVNIANTPPPRPLDVFEYEVRDGQLFLGRPMPREGM